MEIYLIRHTTPEVEKGIFYGQTDLPVSNSFEKEYAALKPKLPGVFDAVYTSPLQRCAKLAHEISDVPVVEPLIKELDFGEWEMVAYDDIAPDILNRWMGDFVNIPCPDGESFNDLDERATRFWEKLANTEEEVVAVVSHSGIIRSLLAKVMGLPLQNCFKMEVSYGSLSKITVRKQLPKVEFINR